MYEIFFSDYTI